MEIWSSSPSKTWPCDRNHSNYQLPDWWSRSRMCRHYFIASSSAPHAITLIASYNFFTSVFVWKPTLHYWHHFDHMRTDHKCVDNKTAYLDVWKGRGGIYLQEIIRQWRFVRLTKVVLCCMQHILSLRILPEPLFTHCVGVQGFTNGCRSWLTFELWPAKAGLGFRVELQVKWQDCNNHFAKPCRPPAENTCPSIQPTNHWDIVIQ